MNKRIYLNDEWYFSSVYGNNESEVMVRLPHTVAETPFNYFSETMYEKVSGYRKTFFVNENQREKILRLTFEGVAHYATVFINGELVGEHGCGYTAFTLDITPYVRYGEENTLVVKVDSRELLNIPPFGNLIDYMTYGGIYREVYLEEQEKYYLEDVWVTTKDVLSEEQLICVQVTMNEEREGLQLHYTISEKVEGQSRQIEAFLGVEVITTKQMETVYKVKDKKLWDVDSPHLYCLKVSVLKDDRVIDEREVTFGFREAVFKVDGFYLNGIKIKLRGMNRHQSYPYVGYAMPKSQQVLDAKILKEELGLNAVRTSHYPQSQHFIDACDKLGLLVFTEIPGWQYIGDEDWKVQAYRNVEEMVIQYRNHPSIILWGVRINESTDDFAFYEKTNDIAHRLDPYRQTAGVRNIRKGDFQEDVYTYNDFSHIGSNRGLFEKHQVTPNDNKPYLVTEYNGHMFPTKSFDHETKRLEHSLRHAKVIDAYYEIDEVAGGFGWCMFDYNTHKEFGSGDNICHHGVMDAFRNPKLAASIYASQSNKVDVLEVSSAMNIGEHPGGYLGEVYLFTNADEVKFYKNSHLVQVFNKKNRLYEDMPNGPIRINDLIGDGLEREEGFDKEKAKKVKRMLNTVAKYGPNKLPLSVRLIGLSTMMQYKMDMKMMEKLYTNHIGNWGGQIDTYTFEAIKAGQVVKTVTKAPNSSKNLKVIVDHTKLMEETTYDVALVRLEMCDDYGNRLSYYQEPISLEVEGKIELIGPQVISLKGGVGGTYVKTIGEVGTGKLILRTQEGKKEEVVFEIIVKKEN